MTQQTTAIQPKSKVQNFSEFLQKQKDELAKVMPKTLTPERVVKVAIAAFSKTPKLQDCTVQSVYLAIHQSVQLGLEPGSPLGHAYLVPYGTECTLVVGYKGLIALARRSGEIATIEAHVVRARDTFDVAFGTDPRLVHRPYLDGDAGDVKFVYAIASLRDGCKQWEVMTVPEIEHIRKKSKAANGGPWVSDWAEMARKTVVKRLCKYLPMSVEMADAIDADNANEPIDVTPPKENPAAAARIVRELRSAEESGAIEATEAEATEGALRAPVEAPAEKRATESADDLERNMTHEIEMAENLGALTPVGNAIERAAKNGRIDGETHARLRLAFQKRVGSFTK